MPLALGRDQAGFFQDTHVMGHGGLGQLHPLLDIKGAKAGFLSDGVPAFFFECSKNMAARWIGNGVQKTIHIRSGVSHDDGCVIV